MAAYGALVSVMHIVEQIQNHPYPPISFDQKQVESLTENVTFLQGFLENYPHDGSEEADRLESCIAMAAYVAEDVIECYVVDQIHAGSTSSHTAKISFIDFYQGLQEVIEGMDMIKEEVIMEIKFSKTGIHDQLFQNSTPDGYGSSRPYPPKGENIMVGFDDLLTEIMDKLNAQQFDGLIIPIVGMGGIGKTTISRNIYANMLKGKHFDILAWVTISHNYTTREICIQVLCQVSNENRGSLSQKSENELGEMLHKYLWNRRYLIVMDDIWSIEAWEQVKFFFPNQNNGSRIVMTTRLSNLAFQLTGSLGFKINFLDEGKDWNLFCQIVFGQVDCPHDELEEIGKIIAKNCQGLPLSIVVIGRLLAKSKQTREFWEYIAENLISVVNLEDNERCLKILYTSYHNMPVYLKPCFLYVGVFPEDSEIRVSELIKLWVSEGFLKPNSGKSLEVVAEEYLNELIDRNLILVHKLGSNGKIKYCKIHDLLRDLCLREVQKHKFLCVIRQNNMNIQRGINTQRRIGIDGSILEKEAVLHALQDASLARSLLLPFKEDWPLLKSPSLLRILRIDRENGEPNYQGRESYWNQIIRCTCNLRCIAYPRLMVPVTYYLPPSVCLLWNLHTLICRDMSVDAPSEIWKMPLLKHLEFFYITFKVPPLDGRDDFVLGNLQTLLTMHTSSCPEGMVRRIPNIKKLKVFCYSILDRGSLHCFNNLHLLHKLVSLGLSFHDKPDRLELLQNLTFPHSLKKLTLWNSRLHWEDVTTKIGSLPLLEVLKLQEDSVIGPEWETVDGQFCRLKFLLILKCRDLEYWTTDSTHFPCLEHLHLQNLDKLKEIPSSIGDIPTLRSINLNDCCSSANNSAKTMLEEQLENGNESLRVGVIARESDNELESFAKLNRDFEYVNWLDSARPILVMMQEILREDLNKRLTQVSIDPDGIPMVPTQEVENRIFIQPVSELSQGQYLYGTGGNKERSSLFSDASTRGETSNLTSRVDELQQTTTELRKEL